MRLKSNILVACVFAALSAFADIMVSDVKVFSGYPWKEVVVGYTITGMAAETDIIQLTATDKSANTTYTARSLTGAVLAEGRHVLRWNAASEGAKFSSSNVVFSVSIVPGGVQLWANGPYWAECNVGATKPEECGYYFWWGDTVGYVYDSLTWNATDGSKTGYSFSTGGCPTYGKDNATLRSQGYIDAAGNLVAKYDAATRHLGVLWRMPTDAEWDSLESNCTTIWTKRNGVYGRLVSGKGDYVSRSIFLPASGFGFGSYIHNFGSQGYYWSSTSYSDSSDGAWFFGIDSDRFTRLKNYRGLGKSVRPLRGFVQ